MEYITNINAIEGYKIGHDAYKKALNDFVFLEQNQTMLYHNGFLAIDRESNSTLHKIANYLYNNSCSFENGDKLFSLTQKKLKNNHYLYFVTKKGK